MLMARDEQIARTIIKYLLPDGRIVDVVGPDEKIEFDIEGLMSPAKLVIDASSGKLVDIVDYK
jgi:hypothetical protein